MQSSKVTVPQSCERVTRIDEQRTVRAIQTKWEEKLENALEKRRQPFNDQFRVFKCIKYRNKFFVRGGVLFKKQIRSYNMHIF